MSKRRQKRSGTLRFDNMSSSYTDDLIVAAINAKKHDDATNVLEEFLKVNEEIDSQAGAVLDNIIDSLDEEDIRRIEQGKETECTDNLEFVEADKKSDLAENTESIGSAEEAGSAEEIDLIEDVGSSVETEFSVDAEKTTGDEETSSDDDKVEASVEEATNEDEDEEEENDYPNSTEYDEEEESDTSYSTEHDEEESDSSYSTEQDEDETTSDNFKAASSEAFTIVEPRKYHIWPVFITAIAIFILLTGGLTYYNRTVMASQTEEMARIKQQGDELLEESIAYIQEADSVVIALDKTFESRINEEDIPKIEALLDQLDSTNASLDNAIEKAKQAMDIYVTKEDKALAQHAIDAADYRKQMLTMSSQLANYDIAALRCVIALEYAWNLIVAADTDMRMAVEVVDAGGANAVSESRDYNQSAYDKLYQAQQALNRMPEIFPGIDIKSINDYLVAKIESVELALASDDAYLAGYYTTANERNEEFRMKDLEVVELAANLPSNPMTLVITIYESTTGQLREEYKNTRLMAADADAFLRAYLGVANQ